MIDATGTVSSRAFCFYQILTGDTQSYKLHSIQNVDEEIVSEWKKIKIKSISGF